MIFIKRLLVIFITLVILCGCAGEKIAIKSEFLLEANAEIDGTSYTAEITLEKNGEFRAEIVDAGGLSGLCYTYRDGEGALSYNGMTLPLPENARVKSFTEFLAQTLNKCQKGEYIGVLGGTPVYESEGYTLVFNSEGYPQSLYGNGVKAEFKIK